MILTGHSEYEKDGEKNRLTYLTKSFKWMTQTVEGTVTLHILLSATNDSKLFRSWSSTLKRDSDHRKRNIRKWTVLCISEWCANSRNSLEYPLHVCIWYSVLTILILIFEFLFCAVLIIINIITLLIWSLTFFRTGNFCNF